MSAPWIDCVNLVSGETQEGTLDQSITCNLRFGIRRLPSNASGRQERPHLDTKMTWTHMHGSDRASLWVLYTSACICFLSHRLQVPSTFWSSRASCAPTTLFLSFVSSSPQPFPCVCWFLGFFFFFSSFNIYCFLKRTEPGCWEESHPEIRKNETHSHDPL